MEQQACVHTATILGVEAVPVTVEVNVGPGLPGIVIVGMPDAAVQESKQRVRLALRACGFSMPNSKVVVNLAPSSLKKNGSGFDLPIAVGILRATKQVSARLASSSLFVGELSLEGAVRGVRGTLAFARVAREQGLALVTAPILDEAPVISDVDYRCIQGLQDLRDGSFHTPRWQESERQVPTLDYSEIAGQDLAKRALQIAAVGDLGCLMVGPPGSGKTMLARRLPTILPPLSEEERVESALIHSIAGVPYETILRGERPFRAPHHSATRAGLLGGGTPVMPGEVSLAHNGVLFLDEMPEFGVQTLQLLRQPLESGEVVLARAEGSFHFPARFSLVAAANPCPCGFFGDRERNCRCTQAQVSTYQSRIGGPLMDRFDLCLDVWRTDPTSVLATGTGKGSRAMREEVLAAREFAAARPLSREQGEDQALLESCCMDEGVRASLEALALVHHLSGRGIIRTLRVARAIADLDQSLSVRQGHLEEAVMFRVRTGEGL